MRKTNLTNAINAEQAKVTAEFTAGVIDDPETAQDFADRLTAYDRSDQQTIRRLKVVRNRVAEWIRENET